MYGAHCPLGKGVMLHVDSLPGCTIMVSLPRSLRKSIFLKIITINPDLLYRSYRKIHWTIINESVFLMHFYCDSI